MSIVWYNSPAELLGINPSREFLSWLTYTGSTTKRLEKEFNINLVVKLLSRGNVPSWHPDYNNIPRFSWSRNSYLYVEDKPWMLASIVLEPGAILKKDMQQVFTLGENPIGNLLYSGSKVERSDVQFALVNSSTLPLDFISNTPLVAKKSTISSRFGCFYILEIFLPHGILHNI